MFCSETTQTRNTLSRARGLCVIKLTCSCLCVRLLLHIPKDECINQLWKCPSSAHASNVRNRNDSRTSKTRISRLFLVPLAPLKKKNESKAVDLSNSYYQENVTRRAPCCPALTQNSSLSLGATEKRSTRSLNQSASSLLFLQLFPSLTPELDKNGRYTNMFLYLLICRLIIGVGTLFLSCFDFDWTLFGRSFEVALSVVLKWKLSSRGGAHFCLFLFKTTK